MELSLDDLQPFLPGLESVLEDDEVSELMVNGPGTVFVERIVQRGQLPLPRPGEPERHRPAL